MKKRSFFEHIATAPYVFWASIFIIGPLLVVLSFAFTNQEGKFTFENIPFETLAARMKNILE